MTTDTPPGKTLEIPRSDGARTDEVFWDAQWNQRAASSLSNRLLHGRDFERDGHFLRLLERHVGLVNFRDARVVELGGASSRFLVALARHAGSHVTAVDYSPVGVSQTEQLFAAEQIEGRALLGDIFSWDGNGERFDVVLHFGLLEHFDNPTDVLAASAQVLRPGGLLVFTMPNLDAIGAKIWAYTAPDNFSKHVYHSDRTIESTCTESGLQLVKIFHAGPPLVRMAPPERGGLASTAANAVHAVLCMLGTAAPWLYTGGHARLSNTRGFVARKSG